MLQKRYTPLFLVMLGLVLAACNQGLEEDRIRIGFSQCFDDHPFRSKMNDEMRIMAALYPNVELVIKEASGSHEKQVGHVDTFIEEDMDVIIVSAVNGDSISPKNEPFWVYVFSNRMAFEARCMALQFLGKETPSLQGWMGLIGIRPLQG